MAQYVDLGFSLNGPFPAKVGDIVTFEVEEITWDQADKRLNWMDAKPLDIDRERSEPYAAAQVIDMARRARVLQEVPAETAKRVRQPLKSPGGKTRIADKLARLIPPHSIYVEPYAGGAALFWHKAPSKREVLNDINTDIMSLYQFLQKATDAELDEFVRRDWEGRESLFVRLVTSKPRALADRAYRTWYISYFGCHGPHSDKSNFIHANAGKRPDITLERLQRLRERLRGVVLKNDDAVAVIQQYDGPDTFFYLDPPYLGTDAEYRHRGQPEHLAKLGAVLRHLQGKALISCNRETLAALRLPSSWRVRKVAVPYPMTSRATVYELVASNYDIAKAAKAAGPSDEGGETRGEAALRNWEAHWHEAMPLSGAALPFILHAHWRGLTEQEAQLDLEALLQTNNSLHFDLRLGTDRFNGWWGISLFAGSTEENRKELRIFRMMRDPEMRLESAPKQFGPAPWLKVGLDQPLVVEQGGVGSTARAWSKFFAIDHGTWRLGMARQHAVEIWLDGQHLKGRFMWQFATDESGRRYWLFTRPDDQKAYAQSHDVRRVIEELRQKHQRYLVWPRDPEHIERGMQLIDVTRVQDMRYRVLRAEPERRYTLGVVYMPNRRDAHGDWARPETIEQACWHFTRLMRQGRATIGLMHLPNSPEAGEVVENYIQRGDTRINGVTIPDGTWLMGVIWREDVWRDIKARRYRGLSLQGTARLIQQFSALQ